MQLALRYDHEDWQLDRANLTQNLRRGEESYLGKVVSPGIEETNSVCGLHWVDMAIVSFVSDTVWVNSTHVTYTRLDQSLWNDHYPGNFDENAESQQHESLDLKLSPTCGAQCWTGTWRHTTSTVSGGEAFNGTADWSDIRPLELTVDMIVQ